MDIQDVVTEFKAYYQDRGQNTSRLYQVLRRKLASESIFTTILTDDTVWQGAKVSMGRLVQAYQSGFTPINPLAFKPIEIRMFHHKVDTNEIPHNLEESWLGFLADSNVSPKDWPFVRWWIEQQIVPQIEEDMETLEIAKGVRVEPTTGTPGQAGNGMDGFLTIMKNHITASRTTPIAMGAIPVGLDSDVLFVRYIEDLCDQIDDKYWTKAMDLNLSPQLLRKYRRGQRSLYGKDTVDNAISNTVKETSITVVSRDSMIGKSRIFCTPKDNAVVLKKKTQNQKRFDVQPFDRQVKVLTDWFYGVGFVLPELIFCNDQE